ncbi:MAG: alpha/beta hydrolase [Spirochaetes bacterium]|nr:alpha/beta hydrolase [Spirochaetota bacterium]
MNKITDLKTKIDPELSPSLDMMPPDGIDFTDLQAMRAASEKMFGEMAAMMPPVPGVKIKDRMVPGPENSPEVGVRIYSPENSSGKMPALLWIHGGGYIAGSLTFDDYPMKQLCASIGCIIVSVNYRLAPENPFPAATEDCYASLKWMAASCEELQIDKSRIAIGGGSAGGGLAAGLAILVRDRGEINIIFQLLIYPMLDNRNVTHSSHTITDPRTWDRSKNLFAWEAYLGKDADPENVSPYAAASREKNLSGLPPAYIAVGELDLFLDENIEYAQKLLQAGVSTELHVYPGATHGFDGMATASVSMRFIQERNNALKKAFKKS